MFYELLTGHVPFTGDTPVAIAMKHLEEEPVPPSEANAAVSAAMDFVVLRAIEKKPRNRYVSAAEMMRDIRLALEHPDTILAARAEMERMEREARLGEKRRKKTEKRVKWMRRTLVAMFSLLLLGIIAFSGYTITDRLLRERRRTIEVPNVIGLLSHEGLQVLEAAGIQPAVRIDEYPLIAENIIADQSAAPGSFVAPGEVVTIVVCKSKFDLTAPNLVSMHINTAIKTLADLNLQSENVYVINAEVREDSVIEQDPKPGEPIKVGDVIKLTISAGYVRMPRLIGQTLYHAQQSIMAFKLVLSETVNVPVDDPELIGKVINQVPVPYAEVKNNTTVQLEMGVPAGSLFDTEVTIHLSGAIPGASVTVHLAGEEAPQFFMVAEEDETEFKVPLYSQTSRMTEYHVYFDGVLQYTDSVRFE
jgi:serine/threonine-protein kinase